MVALEVLPEHGRERLRAVILPVVYFIVMTSIIVHGITIPIGKGFHRTLTVTRSSQTTGTTTVSRLPPAVPIGQVLPTQRMADGSESTSTRVAVSEGRDASDSKADGKVMVGDEPVVRFQVPSDGGVIISHQREDGDSKPPSRVSSFGPASGLQWSERAGSSNTPSASGRNTPILVDNRATPMSSGRTTPDNAGARVAPGASILASPV